MYKYNILDDLTSDVMFEAFGADLKELLEASAFALFSVICEIDRITPSQSFELSIEAEDEGSLLHSFLSKLLTQSEIEGLFLSEFDVYSLRNGPPCKIKVRVQGEGIRPELGNTVVKGITYYGFKLEKTRDGYRSQVAVDI
ncbi:MAG: archease [Spirochaetales bacterium]|nr:archease [Spirochaetales bacterium]